MKKFDSELDAFVKRALIYISDITSSYYIPLTEFINFCEVLSKIDKNKALVLLNLRFPEEERTLQQKEMIVKFWANNISYSILN